MGGGEQVGGDGTSVPPPAGRERSTERGLGRRRRPPSATTERISTLTSSPPRSRSPTLTPLPPRSRLSTLTPSPSRSRSSTLTPLTQSADRRPRGRGGGTKSWSLTVKEEGGGVPASLGQRGNSDEVQRLHDEA